MQNDIKRILHVVSSMNRGGAETMIMNLYRKIDRKKIQFDFVVHSETKGHYEDEIIKLGGRIIRCGSLGKLGPLKYISQLSRIINKNGPFHAVHSHTDFQGGFVAIAAKKNGVSNRICHSHNTQWVPKPSIVHKIQLVIFKEIIDRYATEYCSCGIDSAKFLFKSKKINNNGVNYINNGIDVEQFNLDSESCQYLRKEFNIDKDTLVIGHIGRFFEQKNHKFIIEIAKKMKLDSLKFKILLAGEGPLLSEIKKEVERFELSENVVFLGVREDIPQLLKVFDVFLFPSFFEGLPVVLVEAQAAGVHCVISNSITREIDFGLGLIDYCNLEDNIENWIYKINIAKKSSTVSINTRRDVLKKLGYDVNYNVSKIMNLYNI